MSDDEYYDEDDFETFEHDAMSPRKNSAAGRVSALAHVEPAAIEVQSNETKPIESPEKEKIEEPKESRNTDLETYMAGLELSETDEVNKGISSQFAPLEGTTPNSNSSSTKDKSPSTKSNEAQLSVEKIKSTKESPKNPSPTPSSSIQKQPSASASSPALLHSQPTKETKEINYLQTSKEDSDEEPSPQANSAMDKLSRKSAPYRTDEDKANALRVDALIKELLPDRYPPKKKKGAAKKAAVAKSYYGLNDPKTASADDDDSDIFGVRSGHKNDPTDALSSLDLQLKQMKRELRAKDEKIARIMEHNTLMASHMERLKGEIALLSAKLHEADMELEAKEARLTHATKLRKKLAKKAAASSGPNNIKLDLENENNRLREREQALMEAIDELSLQNEDLIGKLKESMQRELELSSKRASLISHNVASLNDPNQYHGLPKLNAMTAAGGGGEAVAILRTRSEPQDTGKKRSNKKKKSA